MIAKSKGGGNSSVGSPNGYHVKGNPRSTSGNWALKDGPRKKSQLSRLAGFQSRLDRLSRTPGTTQWKLPQRLSKNEKCFRALRSKKQTHPSPNRSQRQRKRCTLSTVVLLRASLSTGKENQMTDRKRPGEPDLLASSVPRRGEGLHPGATQSPLPEIGGRLAFGVLSWTVVR